MTNFSDMLSKAKAMQDKMKEAQDQIKKIEVEGVAGGNKFGDGIGEGEGAEFGRGTGNTKSIGGLFFLGDKHE